MRGWDTQPLGAQGATQERFLEGRGLDTCHVDAASLVSRLFDCQPASIETEWPMPGLCVCALPPPQDPQPPAPCATALRTSHRR